MSDKRLVLEILEQNRGQMVSGQRIAERLGLSRNMVWRAVSRLRDDGYVVEAVTRQGYRLAEGNDILSVEGLKPFLASPDWADNMRVYAEIDSTNREAKARAIEKAPHGTVILADRQTSGRGRRGRNFFSPPGKGLYMSLILHADALGFPDPTAVTAYAALCVCETIETVCRLRPSIKWVNDIFLDGKKICGILTEGVADLESGGVREIVLGIGLNVGVRPEDFPEELKGLAGSLYPSGGGAVTRNRLAAEIVNRLLGPDRPERAELFARYKKRLFMLGADLMVTQGGESYPAKALDINEQGHLIVQTPGGEIRALSSGEVSVRAL